MELQCKMQLFKVMPRKLPRRRSQHIWIQKEQLFKLMIPMTILRWKRWVFYRLLLALTSYSQRGHTRLDKSKVEIENMSKHSIPRICFTFNNDSYSNFSALPVPQHCKGVSCILNFRAETPTPFSSKAIRIKPECD